jgi:very-short-patch-repair endonuclease
MKKKLPMPATNLNSARKLRADMTDAERLLWLKIRSSQLYGLKFRRQHTLPPYTVDFFCDELNLIIELDGGQHSPESDELRTSYLQGKGFKILRFWNNDVLENIEGVLQVISKERNAKR